MQQVTGKCVHFSFKLFPNLKLSPHEGSAVQPYSTFLFCHKLGSLGIPDVVRQKPQSSGLILSHRWLLNKIDFVQLKSTQAVHSLLMAIYHLIVTGEEKKKKKIKRKKNNKKRLNWLNIPSTLGQVYIGKKGGTSQKGLAQQYYPRTFLLCSVLLLFFSVNIT